MYGHIETPEHWVKHMNLLRDIQKETRGFTEFVPLSLIHQEAPMYQRKLVKGVREGATGVEVIKMHAIARLMLGPTFRNIQSSWVKEGPKLSQYLLTVGANDLGGTLINESISTSAGAQYGQLVPPKELRRLVRDVGRTRPNVRLPISCGRSLTEPTTNSAPWIWLRMPTSNSAPIGGSPPQTSSGTFIHSSGTNTKPHTNLKAEEPPPPVRPCLA